MTPDDPNQPGDTGPIPPYGDTPPLESHEGYDTESGEYDEGNGGMPERGRPAVATGSAKTIIFAFLFLGLLVYVLYSLFSGPKEAEKKKGEVQPAKPSTAQVITPPPAPPPAPATSLNAALPPAPPPPPPPVPPPPPPPPEAVPPVPPPPPPPAVPAAVAGRRGAALNNLPTLPEAQVGGGINFNDKERQRRLKSNMMVMSGGGKSAARQALEAEATKAGNALDSQDPNRTFSSRLLRSSSAEKETATRVSGLDHTIIQGKIIDAVLETAINTDLPGTLRAVISRDVYAEAGREVMIPKGSRLIGSYNTGILRGQKRVFIVWTRVIRPDGVDIAIGSPATDPLGRAGINGYVDNKFMETFSTALLTSMISVGIAVGADALVKNPQSTTVNTDGSTTTTGSAGAAAASQSVMNFGQIAQNVVSSMLDLRPTITVDQGTRLNVFVNRDLIFPTEDNSVFVQ